MQLDFSELPDSGNILAMHGYIVSMFCTCGYVHWQLCILSVYNPCL